MSARRLNPSRAMRGKPLEAPASGTLRFEKALRKLLDDMANATEAALAELVPQHQRPGLEAGDTLDRDVRTLIAGLTKRFDNLFAQVATDRAKAMVSDMNKSSSVAIAAMRREFAPKVTLPALPPDGKLAGIVSRQTTTAANLIRTIPEDYLGRIQRTLFESVTTGNGMEQVLPALQDLRPTIKQARYATERHINLMAMDQTRKVYNGLAEARMINSGLEEYEWLHSGGSLHPRELHLQMDGKVFRFDTPPVIDEDTGERGKPGDAINCRCRMVPVLNF